eukprot:6327849-Amphidinium_carterae.1
MTDEQIFASLPPAMPSEEQRSRLNGAQLNYLAELGGKGTTLERQSLCRKGVNKGGCLLLLVVIIRSLDILVCSRALLLELPDLLPRSGMLMLLLSA